MGWAKHVARLGRKEMDKILWLENLKEREHSEDLRVDGKIILKWIFIFYSVGRCGLDASGLG